MFRRDITDTYTAILDQKLSDGEQVVAPRGPEVTGRVVESDPGGRAKGQAKISVELVSLKTAAGKQIPIATAALSQEAGSTLRPCFASSSLPPWLSKCRSTRRRKPSKVTRPRRTKGPTRKELITAGALSR